MVLKHLWSIVLLSAVVLAQQKGGRDRKKDDKNLVEQGSSYLPVSFRPTNKDTI